MRTVLCLTASALLAGAAACAQTQTVEQGRPNVPEFEPAFPEQTRAPEQRSGVSLAVETIASGLEHAWGMALLPDGGYLVTERPGRLRVVAPDGTLSDPVQGLPEVLARGQGGLLDVAVSRWSSSSTASSPTPSSAAPPTFTWSRSSTSCAFGTGSTVRSSK
jgi:glucose/arabinose dehydrogenase